MSPVTGLARLAERTLICLFLYMVNLSPVYTVHMGNFNSVTKMNKDATFQVLFR